MGEQTAVMERAARNADLIREGYAAFAKGDLAAVGQMFDANLVWHAYRLGQLGGDHAGWPAVQEFFMRTVQLTDGTFRVEPLEILANEDGAAAVVRSSARRGDGRTLDSRQIHQFRVVDGTVREVWQFVGDGKAAEEFWS